MTNKQFRTVLKDSEKEVVESMKKIEEADHRFEERYRRIVRAL